MRSAYVFWHRRALTRARRIQTSLSRLWKGWVNEFQLRAHVIWCGAIGNDLCGRPKCSNKKRTTVSRFSAYARCKSPIVCTIQQGLFKRIVACKWLRHERAIVRIDEQRQALLNIERDRFTESLYSNETFMEEFQLAQQRVHIELEQFRA